MKKIFRCRHDRKIGGVIGGLSRSLCIDSNLLRLFFLFLLFTPLFPIVVIGYFIFMWLLPEGGPFDLENRAKRLYRPIYNRKIAGVCAGLGEYFSIDPNIIRIIMILLLIATIIAPIIISYIFAIFIIPERR